MSAFNFLTKEQRIASNFIALKKRLNSIEKDTDYYEILKIYISLAKEYKFIKKIFKIRTNSFGKILCEEFAIVINNDTYIIESIHIMYNFIDHIVLLISDLFSDDENRHNLIKQWCENNAILFI